MNHTRHSPPATSSVAEWFSQTDFMPHGHCYLWKPGLVWTHVISDALIGIAYFAISLILWRLVRRIQLPFTAVVLSFGVFIGACGLTHFMEIWNLWNADYWWGGWLKVLTAAASVATGIYLFKLRHPIVTVAQAAKLSEQRRLDLEALTKDLETRVSERTRELEDAIRARDNFLSIASHELNTPLTSLRLQTQLLERKLKGGSNVSENVEKYSQLVAKQTDRISRLVNDMLDVSRIQSGKLEVIKQERDLCEFLHEVTDRFCMQFDHNQCRIDFKNCTTLRMKFDPFKIEQVLMNLFTNALKYAPESLIHVSLDKKDDHVRITVRDEGQGIPSENLEKIFYRFERAVSASEVSGLGLGLYISREIVENHGGKIWAESAPGQGATFVVELPFA